MCVWGDYTGPKGHWKALSRGVTWVNVSVETVIPNVIFGHGERVGAQGRLEAGRLVRKQLQESW